MEAETAKNSNVVTTFPAKNCVTSFLTLPSLFFALL